MDDTQTLANFGGGGPGPWILLLAVIWALVIGDGIVLLRRTVWADAAAAPGGGPPPRATRPSPYSAAASPPARSTRTSTGADCPC
ncbi:hypothetical protein HDC93_003550 [Streptomyces sp. AK010]|nr:hypothetical protein [Streptomyces sp. AK010]